MSAPNPLIPQGTFQAQAVKGASNVRLAVATIVAIHIVFFGGLLLQGCKRDPKLANTDADTNSTTLTNLSLAPIDSNSLYYPTGGLPPESGTQGANAQLTTPSAPNANAESLWQSTNLASAGVGANAATSDIPTKEYTIVSGDSFGRIAQRNGTTVSAMRAANPGVDPVKIRPGQKINVPIRTQSSAAATLNNNAATSASNGAAANTYVVKPGDNLTKIANKHKTTVRELRAANNLTTSRVNVGQKLKIPSTSAPSTALPTNDPLKTPVF